jgi:hypothetical protein
MKADAECLYVKSALKQVLQRKWYIAHAMDIIVIPQAVEPSMHPVEPSMCGDALDSSKKKVSYEFEKIIDC